MSITNVLNKILTRHAVSEYGFHVTGAAPAPRGVLVGFAVRVPSARQKVTRVGAGSFDTSQLSDTLVVGGALERRRFFPQA